MKNTCMPKEDYEKLTTKGGVILYEKAACFVKRSLRSLVVVSESFLMDRKRNINIVLNNDKCYQMENQKEHIRRKHDNV